MSCTTSCGWDTIATWLDGTSAVVAPIRAANWRSASGGMASSLAATRYQVGCDFQAGTPITSPNEDAARGWLLRGEFRAGRRGDVRPGAGVPGEPPATLRRPAAMPPVGPPGSGGLHQPGDVRCRP